MHGKQDTRMMHFQDGNGIDCKKRELFNLGQSTGDCQRACVYVDMSST
jgi:hypothetical protein